MHHSALLTLFDQEMRRDAVAVGPDVRTERAGGVVRQSGGEHDWNGVLWSDLDAGTARAAIAAQVKHFASLGVEFEWKLYSHDRPAHLAELLLAAGFTAGPAEALMVAEAQRLTAGAGLPEGVRLVPVTDTAGARLVADVHEQAFGTSGSRLARQLSAQLLETPDVVSAVVAMAGGVPVSAARMELPPGKRFAGLWGGGTVEAWRGKGLYRELIAHRARIAVARGYEFLQVDASDLSRPILRRLGFAHLGTTTPYTYGP